jgi:hypothetical protein
MGSELGIGGLILVFGPWLLFALPIAFLITVAITSRLNVNRSGVATLAKIGLGIFVYVITVVLLIGAFILSVSA